MLDPFAYEAIPGLIRPCAPVLVPRRPLMRGGIAVVVEDYTIGIAHQGRILWEGPHNVRLDYSSSFGRHCAREWLEEHGHPTTEDGAEVLAWSVVSVSRGGKPLIGTAWAPDPGALARGWALFDPENFSLTLPPLPEVVNAV